MKARAPGKLILTGEHAVVYGRPAVVTAVNRYADCTIHAEERDVFRFLLNGLDKELSLSSKELARLHKTLNERYERFKAGELPIKEVHGRPAELTAYSLACFFEKTGIRPAGGLTFEMESSIPLGSGMGSSAAVVLTILQAADAHFHCGLDRDSFFRLAMMGERLQHGNPSGADPYVCLHGGMHRFQKKQSEKLPCPKMTFHLAQTGRPESGTGECVSFVAKHFGTSGIWREFELVGGRVEKALLSSDWAALQEAVADNQALLEKIGVVPKRVASFIRDLNRQGCAAKVSGAGSVTGDDHAGIAWVVTETVPKTLCEEYGYSLIEAEGDADGTRIV
ncbi:MAG: mevalonate kinase [Kiritimatiellia bacterium]